VDKSNPKYVLLFQFFQKLPKLKQSPNGRNLVTLITAPSWWKAQNSATGFGKISQFFKQTFGPWNLLMYELSLWTFCAKVSIIFFKKKRWVQIEYKNRRAPDFESLLIKLWFLSKSIQSHWHRWSAPRTTSFWCQFCCFCLPWIESKWVVKNAFSWTGQ
jgi:hypothetical protein